MLKRNHFLILDIFTLVYYNEKAVFLQFSTKECIKKHGFRTMPNPFILYDTIPPLLIPTLKVPLIGVRFIPLSNAKLTIQLLLDSFFTQGITACIIR